MLKRLNHKRDELQEVKFFEDKKCTKAFDFTNASNLYIELNDGDITPPLQIGQLYHEKPHDFTIFTPYIPNTVKRFFVNGNTYQSGSKVKTLNDITPNLSKYIPEDNAVLFLSEECYDKYRNFFSQRPCELLSKYILHSVNYTIFLHHGTQSELQKAEKITKELKEKYGIKPNLCALHWFDRKYCFDNEFHIKQIKKQIENHKQEIRHNMMRQGVAKEDLQRSINYLQGQLKYFENSPFNKIITTNSTGVLKPEDSKERLQVIDCFDIFQDHLNNI